MTKRLGGTRRLERAIYEACFFPAIERTMAEIKTRGIRIDARAIMTAIPASERLCSTIFQIVEYRSAEYVYVLK